MRALDDMVKSGNMFIGILNAQSEVVSQANTHARLNRWTGFVRMLVECSWIEMTLEWNCFPR